MNSPFGPLLMIPGPSDVDEAVLAQMSRQVVAHYGSEWTRFYNETVSILKGILGTRGDLFVYAGSGHLGLDAAIGSLFEPGDTVVAVINGFFGERLEALAASHELNVVRCEAPWGAPVHGEDVGRALDLHPHAKGVLVVHGETSTGVLNPVNEIARAAKARGRLVVVDAVSSAGLAPLDIDRWELDAVVSASQKGFGAPPGVVIVAVSETAWRSIDARKAPIRGWTTNLAKWREFLLAREYQPYFITMPVNVVRALRTSLEAIAAEGMPERIRRHRDVSQFLREQVERFGLTCEAPAEYALPSVSVFRCPGGVSALDVRDAVAERAQIHIAPGLGPWRESRVRIGHMGLNATRENAARLVEALNEAVAALLKRVSLERRLRLKKGM